MKRPSIASGETKAMEYHPFIVSCLWQPRCLCQPRCLVGHRTGTKRPVKGQQRVLINKDV
jgi:hypothetical protein